MKWLEHFGISNVRRLSEDLSVMALLNEHYQRRGWDWSYHVNERLSILQAYWSKMWCSSRPIRWSAWGLILIGWDAWEHLVAWYFLFWPFFDQILVNSRWFHQKISHVMTFSRIYRFLSMQFLFCYLMRIIQAMNWTLFWLVKEDSFRKRSEMGRLK